ncbi:MAG TPA: aminotransferase [Candidatus Coprovicinus avistercoris]|uniref:Aminotransferase n=1 Tax=Candidatus Coprovicinus avistercoris TaxID=2840754 RepID=A0A9D1HWN7_9ACTN|nr:aminotransferase [Candidatus Coprovicinus avistercoris]
MDMPVIGVEDWLNVWERSARVDIAQSTIASLTFEELQALDGEGGATLRDAIAAEKLNYGWIEGSPAFKEQVASLYTTDIAPNRILQTNGCTGANLNALMAVVRPGDHVIAEWPTYAPLYEIPRALGAEVEYWQIHEELGWHPDIEELERLIRPNTRLICINNASNPIGTVLSAEEIEAIVEIASSVGAYVLSDEVYLPLEDTDDFVSVVDVYDRGIVTNSVSKTYSLPAARIGWVIANDEISQAIRILRDYTMISGGAINDCLATYVLAHRDRVLARNSAIMQKNRAIVEQWAAQQPRVHWTVPKGVSASYVRFDLPNNLDDETFCLDLLHKRGVLLVPGSRFELPCGARLGYCARSEVLEKGLTLLGEALSELD